MRLFSRNPVNQVGSLDQLRPISRAQRWMRVAAVFLLVTALCGYLEWQGALTYVEYYVTKFRKGAAGEGTKEESAERANNEAVRLARQQIVLVPISDPPFRKGGTFAKFGAPPVPRSHHARLIRELTKCGAKVIAFDLVFDLTSPHDAELAAAAREHGRVIWGCAYADEKDPNSDAFEPNATLRNAVVPARAHMGHLLVPQNEELPEIDRIHPFLERHDGTVGAFSVQAALLSLGLEKETPRYQNGAWQIGSYSIPVNEEGHFGFTFFGKPMLLETPGDNPHNSFSVVAYEEFFQELPVSKNPFYTENHFFRDKIVFIGDTTKVGNDHRLTPVGDMWGMEIHAHALASLLRGLRGQGAFVRDAPFIWNLLIIAALAAITAIISGFSRIGIAALASCALIVGYFFLNTQIYISSHLKLSLVSPTLAIALAAAAILVERGLIEEKEKNRARGLLGRYVSPQIAEYILANPDKCVLGGERVEATVLFSDIRGFTSMSEKLAPEEVVSRLNEYLQAMTDQVFSHDGAVDKYVGDAIMALFGVPLRHPDHAHRAVETALSMQERLLELQAKWQAEGLPTIDIGIGINTGDMVVGNIGARERLDFTVIGDTVNLASRVEGLNKDFGSRILITRSVFDLVGTELNTEGPFLAAVKGKEEPVEVFKVLGWKQALQPKPRVNNEFGFTSPSQTTP